MSIRRVKQHSDRGSIKDLVSGSTQVEPEFLALPAELRMKKLYEFAQITKDTNLQDALGFITTDYISDKNALPLSVYRLRKIIDDIKSKSGNKIEQLTQQFSSYFGDGLGAHAKEYLKDKSLLKTASVRKTPSFWRARK
jgi:hypothetical protein